MTPTFDQHLATAILGIDTLWGGDVMSASGTGRFIADSWFSDEPLPRAHTAEEAVPLRITGGVSAPEPDLAAINAYLAKVDIPGRSPRYVPARRRTLPGWPSASK